MNENTSVKARDETAQVAAANVKDAPVEEQGQLSEKQNVKRRKHCDRCIKNGKYCIGARCAEWV